MKFLESDLYKPLYEVFGGVDKLLCDFGISGEDYKRITDIDMELSEYADDISYQLVNTFGFKSIDEFKLMYIKIIIWKNYIMSLKSELTLYSFLKMFYNNTMTVNPYCGISEPPLEGGNIIEYLMSFDIQQLKFNRMNMSC